MTPMTQLKFLRLAAGRTALSVCLEADMDPARYSHLERGLLPPRPQERAALARIFGATESTLFRTVRRKQRETTDVN
jgi:transcriptional regulator with XRE-family HTH domain